ncbi:hypothetical protein TYRP_008174 [Tyrophagus putrescentiae]|nr:hypothetical protein TYRP_008174 [Tyrophagus putrescentiae]
MFKAVIVISSFIVCATAGGYGSRGQSMGGMMSSYGMSSGGSNGGGGYGSDAGQVVQAAVHSRHEVKFYDVESSQEQQPITVEVGANSVPLNILFRSASSNLNIQQMHDSAQGSNQETSSEDEPHFLKHQVTKPIIQEVYERIVPSRKITQMIEPVKEEIITYVARDQNQEKRSSGGYGGSMSGSSGFSYVYAVRALNNLFIAVFALVASVSAYGGGGGSGGGGYSSGGAGSGALSGGYSSGGGQGGQTIQAAVKTVHNVQYYDVPSSGSLNPTTIEVGASVPTITILFRSASSNLNIKQIHDGAQGSTQETSSEDEPHVLKHQVTKPIIQEEIQPVQEHIETIVAKATDQPQQQLQQQQQLVAPQQQLSAPRQLSSPSALLTPKAASPLSSTGFLGSSRPLSFGSSGGKGGLTSLGSLGSTKGGY